MAERAVVIGAGIVGAATAYVLAEAGYHVTILEREAAAATQTSFANGAQLSYSYVEPLARPGMLRQTFSALFGNDFALRVRKDRFDLALLSWGIQFLRQCTRANFERNARGAFDLSLQSAKAMRRIASEQSFAFDHARAGKLVLYSDEQALDGARALTTLKRQAGFDVELLSAAQCQEREPALSDYRGKIAGAVLSKTDEAGDANQFAAALIRECQSRYGAQTLLSCEVTRLELKRGFDPMGGDESRPH